MDLTKGGPLFDMHTALEGRLKAVFPERLFEHATLPVRITPQVWVRLLRRTPFIGLGWRGIKPDPASARVLKGQAEWMLVTAVRNANSPRSQLVGDELGPGELAVVQVACAALQGFTIDGIGLVSVEGVANLQADAIADENTAIAAINFTVGFAIAQPMKLDDFLRLGVTWTFDQSQPALEDLYPVRDQT